MNDTQAIPDFPPNDDLSALRAIVEGTAHDIGEAFLQSLVRNLAAAAGTRYAFVAEFAGGTRARTLAFWFRDRITDNMEWDVTGTPCEEVVRGSLCHYPSGVRVKFPDDKPLENWGVESYLGVPLRNAKGEHLGHLAVFDEQPLPPEPCKLLLLRISAARATAELERLRYERAILEREERYRDLFDEAPIGYIVEELDSRFITANRAAMRMLGLEPHEVLGTVGMSLVTNKPANKQLVHELFASIAQGSYRGDAAIELRRKNDGHPVWVKWYSRPDPAGKYTRTVLVDITERILAEQASARLQAQNLYLQEEIKGIHNFEEIIGQSPTMTTVLENVRRVAATDATVLISGETGTGKELIARAVHSNSGRKAKPLIKINCAALPAGLVESELFGHEKCAFTGAIARRVGRFELADGGTIFLDEIGELPADAQAKLLRVLQEREFDRIGGSKPIRVDVRILAATNRDLLKAVREKTFREDLYYRLSVFPVQLPPLRDRQEDIPPLVLYLVNKFAKRTCKRIDGVDKETMGLLLSHTWPGNVRELENVIERAVILANGNTLHIDPVILAPGSSLVFALPESTMHGVERDHILNVLKQTRGVIGGPRGAAAILDLHPNTLRSRMKKLGIGRDDRAES